MAKPEKWPLWQTINLGPQAPFVIYTRLDGLLRSFLNSWSKRFNCQTSWAIASTLSAGRFGWPYPPKKNRKIQRDYDKYLYTLRHLVENAFLHLKRWRGIATRYAKNEASFLAAVQIRCIALWARISWRHYLDDSLRELSNHVVVMPWRYFLQCLWKGDLF